jgi:hypothetical protein
MSKWNKKPVIVVVTSDHHTGSTVGVCPPEGVRLDDGGCYTPSKPQVWLWECWVDFWKTVKEVRRKHRADLWVIYNGDMVDGDHHQTHQIISRNPDAQHYVASRVFGVAKDAHPNRLFVVRGTATHTGDGGSAEEALAKTLGAERDAETETWSRYHLRLEAYGVLMDFQHHGRMGQRPWTKQNAVNALAAQIFYEHAARGWDCPDLAFRSHMHQYGDSFNAHPVRVIQTPAWQLKTGYVHKVAPESIADVGGIITLVNPSGQFEVTHKLYTPSLPEIVT